MVVIHEIQRFIVNHVPEREIYKFALTQNSNESNSWL
jgi:hypothetical protein